MSPDQVTARLQALAEASASGRPLRQGVDMSPEAIDERLQILAQVSAVCFELVAATRAPETR